MNKNNLPWSKFKSPKKGSTEFVCSGEKPFIKQARVNVEQLMIDPNVKLDN